MFQNISLEYVTITSMNEQESLEVLKQTQLGITQALDAIKKMIDAVKNVDEELSNYIFDEMKMMTPEELSAYEAKDATYDSALVQDAISVSAKLANLREILSLNEQNYKEGSELLSNLTTAIDTFQ